MPVIYIYNNGQRVGKTSKAFNIVETKELLSGWTLNFSVVNTDSVRKYIIDPNAVYEIDGQQFDIVTYDQESGNNNITSATSVHVSDRLNNYNVPTGYSFVGRIQDIIRDILNVSGASSEFNCENTASPEELFSFHLNNTQDTTAREAILGLTALGVEPSFDNFFINAPVRWGSDTGKVFQFSRDLCNLKRSFSKTTVPWSSSYQIDIADLQRLPSGSLGDEFVTGDTVGILDTLIGDSIVNQRVISYEKHHDDPTQDKVTIGKFIPDMADTVQTMQVQIDNTVQQGESYNNVQISRKKGLECTRQDGKIKATVNATDGFKIAQVDGMDELAVFFVDTDGNAQFQGTVTSKDTSGNSVVISNSKISMKDANASIPLEIRREYTDSGSWITYFVFNTSDGKESRIYQDPSNGSLCISGQAVNISPTQGNNGDDGHGITFFGAKGFTGNVVVGTQTLSFIQGILFSVN